MQVPHGASCSSSASSSDVPSDSDEPPESKDLLAYERNLCIKDCVIGVLLLSAQATATIVIPSATSTCDSIARGSVHSTLELQYSNSYAPHYDCVMFQFLGLTSVVFLVLFNHALRHDSSTLKRYAKAYFIFSWATGTQEALSCALQVKSCHAASFGFLLGSDITIVGVVLTYLHATHLRVGLIEEAFGEQLGSKRIGLVVKVVAVIGVVSVGMQLVSVCSGILAISSWIVVGPILFQSGAAIGYVLVSTLASKVVAHVLRTVSPAVGTAGYVGVEATWSSAVLHRMRWAVVVPAVSGSVARMVFCVRGIARMVDAHGRLHGVAAMALPCVQTVAALSELSCLFITLGIWRPLRPEGLTLEAKAKPPQRPRLQSKSIVWESTVQSIASRSIDVETLLDFFRKLGKDGMIMRNYDPYRSTTNDVVWQAILPLSRTSQGGSAYATIMRPAREEAYADCMVTHTWSNLFLDLVAAVVGDALGEYEFEAIANELVNDPCAVNSRLLESGVLSRRYWICCFCINQHATICKGPSPDMHSTATEQQRQRWNASCRDTVTGKPFGVCPCMQPIISHQQTDESEVNKFDDMMALLRLNVPHLRQVVAVDRSFDLFTRAWCVAELVEAYFTGIRQCVYILSNDVLDIHAESLAVYIKLVNLTVTNCEASRAEDKIAILARIPDVEEFDRQLQCVIFGDRGLLQQKLLGFGTLDAAVRVSRRVAAAMQARR